IPAAAYLKRRGTEIALNNRVQSLLTDNSRVIGVVDQHGHQHFADAVILALPPSAQTKLLPGSTNPTTEYPICTVYLQYADSLRAPKTMTGFSGSVSQWLFDRSVQQPGLMAVVISGPGSHTQLTKTELISVVSQELADLLPDWPQTADDALVIREKRATFACTPTSQKMRPNATTNIENLWLAGDFVQHPFPATLETAISNGQRCAQQILQIID
ncbi:MAG: FAD-dependent oxidoreductase, partial [Methylophaga sp.]